MLRLRVPTAGSTGSVPGWGTKILHALWQGPKKKKNNKPFPKTASFKHQREHWGKSGVTACQVS